MYEGGGRKGGARNILTGSTNDPADINEANDATDPVDDDTLTNDTSLLSVDKKQRNNKASSLKYDPVVENVRGWPVHLFTLRLIHITCNM